MTRKAVQRVLVSAAIALSTLLALYVACLLALRGMGYSYAVVVSDSMLPTAGRGDLVVVRDDAPVRTKDVVLFRRGSQLIVHRLHSPAAEGGWYSKGDNNRSTDPWIVADKDILGSAIGVLKGFGFPLMLGVAHRDAHAKFTSQRPVTGAVTSTYWANPTSTWTNYGTSTNFYFTAPNSVQSWTTGTRRLYSATRFSGDTRMRFEASQPMLDTASGSPGMTFLINACAGTGDVLTCGYYLDISAVQKKAYFGYITSTGAKSPAISQCVHGATLSSANIFVISKFVNRLTLTVNGVVCIDLNGVNTLVQSVGGSVPTGNHAGFQLTGTNRINATKAVIW